MRLSEAIRLGAMLKPQGRNPRTLDISCALFAAADAVGIHYSALYGDFYNPLKKIFPILNRIVEYPNPASSLMDAIWNLNDGSAWTREQIADWVEGIEDARDATGSEKELEHATR